MRKLYKFAVSRKWYRLANALAYGQASTCHDAIDYLLPDGVFKGSYWRSFMNGYRSQERIGWTFVFGESKSSTDAWLGHGYLDTSKRSGRISIWTK